MQCLENKGDNLYYIQDNHLTPTGHKAVAECLYPQLEEIIFDILIETDRYSKVINETMKENIRKVFMGGKGELQNG